MEIGIIGLGLMGGSLAKALKEKLNCNIVAYNYLEDDLILAKNDGVITEYTFGEFKNCKKQIFKNCQFVFFATPVSLIENQIKELIPYLSPSAIISDLGSTKFSIFEEMEKASIKFIGGHPMTGSEKIGYINSLSFIFENAYYVLTPTSSIQPDEIIRFKKLIEKIGAIPLIMDPKSHDEAVSGISHSPHIIAATLVNTVATLDKDNYMSTLAAGGFKDITRIASSSPKMWTDISLSNKNEIISFMEHFKRNIDDAILLIKENREDEIFNLFENSKEYRDSLENKKSSNEICKITVFIEDKSGIIGLVTTILGYNNISIKNVGIKNSRDFYEGVLEIEFYNPTDRDKSIEVLKAMNFHVA